MNTKTFLRLRKVATDYYDLSAGSFGSGGGYDPTPSSYSPQYYDSHRGAFLREAAHHAHQYREGGGKMDPYRWVSEVWIPTHRPAALTNWNAMDESSRRAAFFDAYNPSRSVQYDPTTFWKNRVDDAKGALLAFPGMFVRTATGAGRSAVAGFADLGSAILRTVNPWADHSWRAYRGDWDRNWEAVTDLTSYADDAARGLDRLTGTDHRYDEDHLAIANTGATLGGTVLGGIAFNPTGVFTAAGVPGKTAKIIGALEQAVDFADAGTAVAQVAKQPTQPAEAADGGGVVENDSIAMLDPNTWEVPDTSDYRDTSNHDEDVQGAGFIPAKPI